MHCNMSGNLENMMFKLEKSILVLSDRKEWSSSSVHELNSIIIETVFVDSS